MTDINDNEKRKIDSKVLENNAENWSGGYIDKRHLIYLSIIAGGIIIVLVSLLFSDSVYAGSMLSFAATLSSILLAVIAIIITLLDVAGQRNNIIDVKNSVEELKNVRSEIIGLIKDFEEKNKKSSEEVVSALAIFRASNKEVIERAIAKVGEINTSDPAAEEKVEDVKRDLEKALARLNIKSFSTISNDRKRELLRTAHKEMKDYDLKFIPKNKADKNNYATGEPL